MTLISRRNEVERELDTRIEVALETVGQVAEANAVREITDMIYNQPQRSGYVRTGRLRNSISHAIHPEEKAAYIGTNVEYAPYVHEGTSRMAPRRFLKAAVEKYASEYIDIFKNIIKNLK